MKIIIYTQIKNEQKEILLEQIVQNTGMVPVMVFDLDGLFQMLKTKISGEYTIVFQIACQSELETLRNNEIRLFNTRFIIILPCDDEDMSLSALSLQPKYLCCPDHGYEDVGRVLNKMNRVK